MADHIFVGVAWPYANGPLHLGHAAGCYLPADQFARYHRMRGNKVLMVSGTDEHGTPITITANREGITPEEVSTRYHNIIVDTFKKLNIQWELFTGTHTKNHQEVVQNIFLDLYKKGYIYLQTQEQLYCPAEEVFLPDRYVEGKCPHCGAEKARGDQCDACGRTFDAKELIEPHCKLCGAKPIVKETDHFFFKWSAFNDQITNWLKEKKNFRPNVMNFTTNYLHEGLRDSAITRDMEWGIPVPIEGYEKKRIYVWWEAVIGYLSASMLWAKEQGQPDLWKEWWQNDKAKTYYFIGKDNIPFHSIRWPAVLMGLGGLNLPTDIPANEFLNLEGRKLSTSNNWAVWVNDYLDNYDPDPLRYALTVTAPENSDSDFSWADFLRRNNDELVGWWGNLVNRSISFIHKHFEGKVPHADKTEEDIELLNLAHQTFDKVAKCLENCQFKQGLAEAMELARAGNRYFDAQAPWKEIKVDRERTGTIMATMVQLIACLRVMLHPFLPTTSSKLHELLNLPGTPEEVKWILPVIEEGHQLSPASPLFKKLDPSIVETERAKLGK
ncbi:methionine--tRNA ligase [bacterium]|nr:methionine--tRNA ligase [bacterium]